MKDEIKVPWEAVLTGLLLTDRPPSARTVTVQWAPDALAEVLSPAGGPAVKAVMVPAVTVAGRPFRTAVAEMKSTGGRGVTVLGPDGRTVFMGSALVLGPTDPQETPTELTVNDLAYLAGYVRLVRFPPEPGEDTGRDAWVLTDTVRIEGAGGTGAVPVTEL